MYTVGVVGLGYVGLTLAVHLAKNGCRVLGVEISPQILNSISSGRAHFHESGFDEILGGVIQSQSLTVDSDYKALRNCDVIFLTLGTPLGSNGQVNLVPLENCARDLAGVISPETLVIVRSTVKIGTTRNVVLPALRSAIKQPYVAYCPERTLEGRALEELEKLPQIVAGSDEESLKRASDFFKSLGNSVVPLPLLEEAELAKLVNNTERDLLFGFANQIALSCQLNNLDAHRVINAANDGYPRSNVKKPGPVGGPCLEKDPHILHESFEGLATNSIFNSGRKINEEMVSVSLNHALNRHFGQTSVPKRVAVLGFAFKGLPPTSDTRGSLVGDLVRALHSRDPNIEIFGHDYIAQISNFSGVNEVNSVVEAVEGAEFVILQNNHPNYADEDWTKLTNLMKHGGLVFDYWNQLDSHQFTNKVNYLAFGGQYVEK